jgi:hypothetical protein
MGYKLRREIRDLLPAGLLTPSERLLVLEIADTCHDEKRTGWPGVEWLVAKCDIPTAKRAGEHLAAIGRKWFEIRVELGKDRHGKPFYAIPGKRMTYRMPTRPELVARHGEDKVPEIQGLDARKDPGNQGAKVPEIQAGTSPDFGDPSPQLEPLKREPSSLSPREDDGAEPSNVTPEPEREIVDTSLKNQNDNPVHRLLLDAGCPTERLTEAERSIAAEFEPRGMGWWRTTAANGDLKVHVAAFLDAGPAAEVCGECDGTGEVGDMWNRRLCTCVWWTDPHRARKDFVSQLKNFPPCPHGINGGDQKAPNGWQYCSQCRGPGWVEPDVQRRTENLPDGYRSSTAAARARQGLAVADELDRQFGHGKYAGNQIHSPADRVVADAEPLYRKYKAQEAHKPFRNPPMSAYYEDWPTT